MPSLNLVYEPGVGKPMTITTTPAITVLIPFMNRAWGNPDYAVRSPVDVLS